MTSNETAWERHRVQTLIDSGVLVVNDGYRAKNAELGEEGLPFARAANVKKGFQLDGADRLFWDRVGRAGIKRSQPGDVVFTSKGTVGRFAFVRDSTPEFVYSPQLCFWRVLDSTKIEPKFLHYWMQGRECEHQFHAAKGSTDMADYISLRDQRLMSITCPPVNEQRRIAKVLGSLDDKIESNRRLSSTLEEVAAALFRARFVDLVGHDDLVKSEIGPIPRGWKVEEVGDVLRVVGGSTPSTKEPAYWEGGAHCWATPRDLSGIEAPILLDTTRHITDAGVDRISSGLLPPRTVLMSSRAPVGYTAISLVPVAVNQGFIAVPPSDDIPSEYILFWLRANMGLIKANAGGTTFAEISKRAFRPLPMLVPPREVVDDFRGSVEPLVSRIAACVRESVALTETRDALLPRLISGRLRLPPGAELVSEAA